MTEIRIRDDLIKTADFISGLQDSSGFSFFYDSSGNTVGEIDILRVRSKLASQESELQPLKCSNGTLVISNSGKIKNWNRRIV